MSTQRISSLYLGVIGVIAIFVLAGCVSRPEYQSTDLKQLGTKEVVGIVTDQGNNRFFLKDDMTGETHMFHTGLITQYIPRDYRSQERDRVRVVYTKVLRTFYQNEGSPYMEKAYQVQSVAVAPGNEMPQMPMKGTLKWIGKGAPSLNSSESFVIELEGVEKKSVKVYLHGSLYVTTPNGLRGLVDRNIEVYARRVPNRLLNCYHYVAERISLPDGSVITEKVHPTET